MKLSTVGGRAGNIDTTEVVPIKPRIEAITPICTEGFMNRSYRYQKNLEVIHQVVSKETA